MGFNNHSPKVTQNVNYAVSKVDTLLFISVIVAIFSCISAYFIGKRIGIQEEKVSWLEQQSMERLEWQKEAEKEFPELKVLLREGTKEFQEKKELQR